MYIFSKEYRKNTKEKVVNYFYKKYLCFKEYTNNKYSDDLLLLCIKAYHMYQPAASFSIMVVAPFIIAMLSFASIIFVLFMFIYFNGCFLTTVELRIKRDLDVTIADPVILLFGDDINNANRKWYSIYTIILYLMASMGVLMFRFYPFTSTL